MRVAQRHATYSLSGKSIFHIFFLRKILVFQKQSKQKLQQLQGKLAFVQNILWFICEKHEMALKMWTLYLNITNIVLYPSQKNWEGEMKENETTFCSVKSTDNICFNFLLLVKQVTTNLMA